MDIKECPECFHNLLSNVEFVKHTGCCPGCGTNLKKIKKKGADKSSVFIIIAVLVLIISIVGFFLWTQSVL